MNSLRVLVACLLLALAPLRAYAALDCCPEAAAPTDFHAAHAAQAHDGTPAEGAHDGPDCAGPGCVQHCAGLAAMLPVVGPAATPLPSDPAPDVDVTRPASLARHAPERPPRPAA
jgi:hypothetical protein